MGTRNKRTLTEGAIPTIFCYSQATKKRKTSEQGQEKNKNSEIVEQLDDNESDLHLQQETSNKFCHESSTETNPVIRIRMTQKKIALFKQTIQKSEPIPCGDCKKKKTLIKITKTKFLLDLILSLALPIYHFHQIRTYVFRQT